MGSCSGGAEYLLQIYSALNVLSVRGCNICSSPETWPSSDKRDATGQSIRGCRTLPQLILLRRCLFVYKGIKTSIRVYGFRWKGSGEKSHCTRNGTREQWLGWIQTARFQLQIIHFGSLMKVSDGAIKAKILLSEIWDTGLSSHASQCTWSLL